jgi:hypothetical protein
MANLAKLAPTVLLWTLAACRPGVETATKTAADYNARTHAEAIARLDADRSLTSFTPRSVDVEARPIAVEDAWLKDCLFDVDGEVGFREQTCREKNGHYELRYYKSGAKVVLARLATEVEDQSDYENPNCLQAGLHGGADMSREPANDGTAPGAPATIVLRMLGVSSVNDVVVREVRYRVKIVNTTCTGTYNTLGYPP